jgi:hypothetical protein
MHPTVPVRALVAQSWLRSAAAGVTEDQVDASITLSGDAVLDYREAHPLARVFPLLDDLLGETVRESDAVMAIADASGQMLWVCGSPGMLRHAETIGFMEGSNWGEQCAGTNAPGMALAVDESVTVIGSEHFRRSMHRWSCAATPIHDPVTRTLLGALDITGGVRVITPTTAALVRAAAHLAEAELARQGLSSRIPDGHDAPNQLSVAVESLGRSRSLMTVYHNRGGPATLQLSPRHSELIQLLTSAEYGLTGDEIAVMLYPEDCGSSTLRAELNRLRQLLGEDLLASRPYRLRARVSTDWRSLEAHLAAGDVAAALRLYRGPLLPGSIAPGVVRAREVLEASLRQALLASHRPELMSSWTRSSWGSDDYEMWQAQLATLPAGSPMLPLAAAQLARLDRDLGIPMAQLRQRPPLADCRPRNAAWS